MSQRVLDFPVETALNATADSPPRAAISIALNQRGERDFPSVLSESLQLLEGKLARLITTQDESAIAFVNTLVTCGGSVRIEYGFPEGFSSYRTFWGESSFMKVKEKLIEEGVLRERPESLSLNIPGIESLGRDQREQLITQLGRFLFETGKKIYLEIMKQVLSSPEGEYVLSEFAKVGPHLREENVDHVSEAVGGKYFKDLQEKLSSQGLFVYAFGSIKHDYYELFPPIIDFMKMSDQSLVEALLFIYLAQEVRHDMFVLDLDARKYEKQIQLLLVRGMIEEDSWYKHRGYRTTLKGSSVAGELVKKRLEESRSQLEPVINKLPPRFVQFLCEVVLDDWSGTMVNQSSGAWGSGDLLFEGKYLCLLNHPKIRNLRDEFFEALVGAELCVKAHNYVSTRGGEVRDLHYVAAREVLRFVQEKRKSDLKLSRSLFPEDLELKHRLFHEFQYRSSPGGYPKEEWIASAGRNGIPPSLYQDSIKELVVDKAILEDEHKWVANPSMFSTTIERRFFLPLVEYLLDQDGLAGEPLVVSIASAEEKGKGSAEKKEEGSDKEIEFRPPLLPYSITFPPYSDGKSLVFGRDQLKDKIALGFEVGRDPSENGALVTWNIHSTDEPFICTFQRIGEGKSTLASCVMLQAAFQGIPVVVFDPKPDYISSLVPILKTLEKFPDYREAILDRFQSVKQDVRGFDLSKPIDFTVYGKKTRLVFQIYSFNRSLRKLGARPLKVPLVFLPPLEADDFEEICASAATTLASAVHSQGIKSGYNRTLTQVFRHFKQQNPEKSYMLPSDLEEELAALIERAQKAEKKRLESFLRAVQGYSTANATLFAQTEQEVARPEELVQNPFYANGDGTTVTITIVDLSTNLPQTKQNPARMNYASAICASLYNLALKQRSSRSAQYLLVMDEAANYLPDPTDQFNQTLVLIRQGRSLGARIWLIAQEPGQIEIQARSQAHQLILSGIREPGIRPELTRWQPDQKWSENLGKTGKGIALVMDKQKAPKGGLLCNLFTSPQTIDLLNTEQIEQIMGE